MAFSTFGGAKPAATGSIFGQPASTPASQPQTSIFGNANASSNAPKPAFGTFGGQNQPAQGTSLFGGQASQQPAQGTSLFGNTLGQPQQQNQGSIFGQTQPAQQSAGTGLFGQSSTGTQQQGQQTSLFGTTSTQNQPAQSTSLFGNTANQPGQTSLFGNTTSQPQQQNQPGLFGGAFGSGAGTGNAALGQSNLGAFGASTAQGALQKQPTLGGFGGASTGLFGKQPSTQPFGAPSMAQSMAAPPFTKSTKFNDLPDEIKKVFEQIDTHIQGRIQISNDLKRRKLGEEATKGQELIKSVHKVAVGGCSVPLLLTCGKDLVNAITVLQSDVHHTRDLKGKVDQCVQDTIIATRIVDGFRNPQQHGMHLKTHASFPLEFFQRVTEEMRDRLRWYKATQIERKLASAAAQSQYTPHSITSTLEAQHATFITLAAKTAAVDAEIQKIKALYTQLWRAKTGSMRDPFNDLDRGTGGDFGLESLSGK
ncbi:hypothetical protein NM688_g2963 [Phlebia brevispora]|uniref:Uncharacterized protein n=1 Tax=Phlebia brevispora TaxID=194682 RepID=A0ACC1T7A6_9APHY|nr:hypothetical protein NM688_g2963 [Phlebia brevispora]